MSDLFDYLIWRGDILFSQLPPNSVDALIFSALSYIDYEGIVPKEIGSSVSLQEASQKMLKMSDLDGRFRVKKDLELLSAAAQTDRFRNVGLSFYQNIFIPEEETQFAAITYLLDDGTAFLTYRGTDKSLVGWKEDFNMSFQDSVPAQRLALKYLQTFAWANQGTLIVGGHSKGGNLAVYAAARCGAEVQNRIREVYNQDGPGFREQMMEDEGYLSIVPKIHTYVPQSSVFGMLMEHKEPYIIIKSKSVSVMQHDPYNWEVLGKDFIMLEELTPDSRFLDRTVDDWLSGMTNEERNQFVDMVFDLVMLPDTNRPRDIVKPQNILTYLKTLQMDEERRRVIGTELSKLIEAGKKVLSKSK